MISPSQIALSPQALKEYQQVTSWKQLRQWHKRFTPSVDDQLFRMLMKQYCGQAIILDRKKALYPNHRFMLKSQSSIYEEEQPEAQDNKVQEQGDVK